MLMYRHKDTIYADAGYILKGEGVIGLVIPDTGKTLVEELLPEFTIQDGYFVMPPYRWNIKDVQTYSDAKKWAVQLRYSNDDQIAIILNKDDSAEDLLVYNKMQEWREWSSLVAHKILEIISQEKVND